MQTLFSDPISRHSFVIEKEVKCTYGRNHGILITVLDLCANLGPENISATSGPFVIILILQFALVMLSVELKFRTYVLVCLHYFLYAVLCVFGEFCWDYPACSSPRTITNLLQWWNKGVFLIYSHFSIVRVIYRRRRRFGCGRICFINLYWPIDINI